MTMFVKNKKINLRGRPTSAIMDLRNGETVKWPPLNQKGLSGHFGGNFATFNIHTTPHPNITASQNLFWVVFYR